MIPLRDDVPSRTYPVVNVLLIAINGLAFLVELGVGEGLPRLFMQAAVVPVLYTGRDQSLGPVEVLATTLHPDLGLRVLVSMFLPGSHFLGNMLYLWIFGDNVEDRMGHFRYLLFYLACGWAAAYGHIWSDPTSQIPSIGASGAIAGVLAAYMTLYPHARVVAVVPLGLFFPLVRIPALFFLGFWFLQNFLLGTLSLAQGPSPVGGTAFWAHIGGFVAGVLRWLFQSWRRRPPRGPVVDRRRYRSGGPRAQARRSGQVAQSAGMLGQRRQPGGRVDRHASRAGPTAARAARIGGRRPCRRSPARSGRSGDPCAGPTHPAGPRASRPPREYPRRRMRASIPPCRRR
jgi:membrane associated rhomboid family serine protease